MTMCPKIVPRLTAYLDGELAGEDGSVVRGHLRECAACRQAARDEAALRDGLRALAPVDPPASLWAGVQAQLAAAEVADAHTPWWRRAARRWTPAMPSLRMMRQLAAGGALAAAAVVALSLHARHTPDAPAVAVAPAPPVVDPHPAPPAPKVSVPAADDVTADLRAEPARTTASYDQVIEELMKLASEARSTWSDERKAAFDARVTELRAGVAAAGRGDHAAGRPQQRAQRAWIRYLQNAVVRDDVMLASGGAR